MANNLTGDYHAVVQISIRQINGLLASLHQNGANPDAPLKLPHSASMRVGDPPKTPLLQVREDLRAWMQSFRMTGQFPGVEKFRAYIAATAPAGAAQTIEGAFSKVRKRQPLEKPPGTVRGRAKIQLSSPTVSAPDGSTFEVALHVDTRVHYYPDPGTDPVVAPEHPVHGEVQATFEIRHQSGKLVIRPSSQDAKIQFIAAQGTNLTAAEVDRISGEVRKVVRDSFTPMPVDLPAAFPFTQFKALGSGSSQVIALPMQLSGSSLSASHLQSITTSFIASSGFAFAVSRQYIATLLTRLSDLIKASVGAFKRYVDRTLDVYYTAKVTAGPTLTWKTGAIEFSIGVQLVGHNTLGVNFDITVEQELTLDLKVSTQVVSIKPVGDPVVHGSIVIDLIELLGGGIVNAIKDARDDALNGGSNSINDMVQDTFLDARQKLVDGLRSFEPSASATFTMIRIKPDGLVVRGDISGAARSAPVVQIAEADQRTAFSALHSWIPGGGIDKFTWSWVEHSKGKGALWSGVTRTFQTEEHRFLLPKPDGVELGNICLRIEGTQITPGGDLVSADSGTTCQVRDTIVPLLRFPSWLDTVTVPMWLADSDKDALLKDRIAGHINVLTDAPRKKNELAQNTLVHFADWHAEQPLEALLRALAAMKRQKVSLMLVVVLPARAFECRRSEAEAKLSGVAERFGARWVVTDDHEGGWARTFATSTTPSTFLIDSLGKVACIQEGEAEPTKLAAALDRKIFPAPLPRSSPLRLAASPCCGSKDLYFEDIHGERFALHRLRGRNVLLNFWQPWSAPCIKELERLQRLQKRSDGPAPFVVAFHGGKEPKIIQETAKQLGLTFTLVHDEGHHIARKYGVRCWPTTISINAEGHVANVQFGAAHEHKEMEPASRKAKSEASS